MKISDSELAKELIQKLLLLKKTSTMKRIYNRITPAEDGKIHCEQSPYGTETTRFAHSKTFLYAPGSTNLANLPKKTAISELYSVRDCLKAEPGRILCKADYSAAEARWCAYMAQDVKRIRMYEDKIDIYKVFVALLKWQDETRWREVGKLLRNVIGKVGILAGQYGVSWKTIQNKTNVDADLTGIAINANTAKDMVDIWPNFFPETLRWHSEVREQVLTHGWLENPFGFRRTFLARRDSPSAREALVREAIASGPQSANAWLLNLSLRELYEKHDPDLIRVLLQVHDEIVFDCAPCDFARSVRTVKTTMEKTQNIEGRNMLIPAEIERCITSWSDSKRVA